MKTIFITSDGKIYRMNYLGKVERDEIKSLKNYLNCVLHLEEGITFETFFNTILKDREFFNEVFKETMGGFDLNQFLKEWKKTTNQKQTKKISYLEIYRNIDLKDSGGQMIIDINNIFEGVIKKNNGDKETITLDFIPINDLKNLPIKINTEFNIPGEIIEGINIISSVKEMTLFEVIESILYEITFYGDPTNRDRIKEDFFNLQNKDNIVELLKYDMEELVSDEKYEEAIEILNLINKYKKTGIEDNDLD